MKSTIRLPTLAGQPVQMFLPGVLNRLRGVKTFPAHDHAAPAASLQLHFVRFVSEFQPIPH